MKSAIFLAALSAPTVFGAVLNLLNESMSHGAFTDDNKMKRAELPVKRADATISDACITCLTNCLANYGFSGWQRGVTDLGAAGRMTFTTCGMECYFSGACESKDIEVDYPTPADPNNKITCKTEGAAVMKEQEVKGLLGPTGQSSRTGSKA